MIAVTAILIGIGFEFYRTAKARKEAHYSVTFSRKHPLSGTVYLFHGLSSTAAQTKALEAALLKGTDFNVARVNYPSRHAASFEGVATAVIDSLEREQGASVVFVGVSIGGVVARHVGAAWLKKHRGAKVGVFTIASPNHGMKIVSVFGRRMIGFLRGDLAKALHPGTFEVPSLDGAKTGSVVATPWSSGPYWCLHGRDDGVVPVASQRWGDASTEVKASHITIHNHEGTHNAVAAFVNAMCG